MRVIRVLILIAGFLVLLPLVVEGRTETITCGGPRTITATLARLDPGDTLLVKGACVENVVIPEQVIDLIIDGQGAATINGPDATKAIVTISGRNITIQNFPSITGGRNGVGVTKGGTATIINNTIQSTGNDGINVSRGGFAVIVLNTIQNNLNSGIDIAQSSSADIGFFSVTDTTASPNTIQNNGNNGITVGESSSARIEGNTISGNTSDGIFVTDNSNVRIGFRSGSPGTLSSPNIIQNNDGAGIVVTRSSSARITGNTISNNTGGGIVVNDSSAADISPEAGVPGGSNTITGKWRSRCECQGWSLCGTLFVGDGRKQYSQQ